MEVMSKLSPSYFFLKNEIYDFETSVREKIPALYTNYVYNCFSNVELDSKTKR